MIYNRFLFIFFFPTIKLRYKYYYYTRTGINASDYPAAAVLHEVRSFSPLSLTISFKRRVIYDRPSIFRRYFFFFFLHNWLLRRGVCACLKGPSAVVRAPFTGGFLNNNNIAFGYVFTTSYRLRRRPDESVFRRQKT